MAVLMILIGILLLLPGVCAGLFVVVFGFTEPKSLLDPGLALVWVVCFAVAGGGVALVRAGRRRNQGGTRPPGPGDGGS